uniref:P-type ATPase C-terminal domain-containing protein n=1 Tax=Lactuca sativa TaxID=4236 RepID=A0A9R1XSE1_LACSA|nr:hypothetical protein LSAT_V11C300119870 [Lactuca sativa]
MALDDKYNLSYIQVLTLNIQTMEDDILNQIEACHDLVKVTRLVKKYTGKMTIVIGDGANDVGMIQAADIEVGINGFEGIKLYMIHH